MVDLSLLGVLCDAGGRKKERRLQKTDMKAKQNKISLLC